MTEASQDAEDLVRAYVDVWNERAYSEIPDLVSDSFVMHDPAAPADGIPGPEGEVHGPDGLETFMRGVATGFPDFRIAISDLISSGELVMYEGSMTMTHEGEFDGIPPTGKRVEAREMAKFRVGDGHVQEHRAYFDQQEIFEQLGIADD